MGKLERPCNKKLISKNNVRRAKIQDELRLAKKKKKCKRDKKPFVGCVLSENGERKELLLGQDGALLRKAEESGAGRPSLYLSLERTSHPACQAAEHCSTFPSCGQKDRAFWGS